MSGLEKEKWDRAAKDYQDVYLLGLNDYNASLLRFWLEEGMLFPGARVIDIGCGVGKYGTYLAGLGCDVTLTDISSEMLRHAEANMTKFTTPWALYCCDFNEVTGREPVFAGGFDLSISTMSPAVHDVDTVKTMSAMTRGWCFLARFYDWEQPYRDGLIRELGLEPRQVFSDLKSDCSDMLRAVCEAGFVPRIKYVDYNWDDPRTPEQMADYMLRRYFTEDENRGELYRESLRIARQHAGTDGFVTDNVKTKVAWIYWRTEELA